MEELIEIKAPIVKPPFVKKGEGVLVIEPLPQLGTYYELDQVLFSLEAESVIFEVVAPESGRLSAIHVKAGDIVKTEQILAFMDVDSKKTVNEIVIDNFDASGFLSGMLGGCLVLILWLMIRKLT